MCIRDRYSTEDSTDKAKKSHKAFVDKNLEFTEGMTSDIVTAYRNFLQKWNPQDETENEDVYKRQVRRYVRRCFQTVRQHSKKFRWVRTMGILKSTFSLSYRYRIHACLLYTSRCV